MKVLRTEKVVAVIVIAAVATAMIIVSSILLAMVAMPTKMRVNRATRMPVVIIEAIITITSPLLPQPAATPGQVLLPQRRHRQ